MNYFVYGVAILAIYPLALAGRKQAWIPVVLAGLIGMLPFVGIDMLTLDLFEQPYRGTARSLEIGALDLCAATLFFALPRAARWAPFWTSRYAYLLVALLSFATAAVPLYTAFEVVKILRAFVVFGVVVRLSGHAHLANALGRGLALGLVYAALYALFQRYVQHSFQVTGGFEHPNSLGMAANLVAPIALAVLMGGGRDKLAAATVVAGAICLVLALSRGALVLGALAFTIVFVGSLARHFSRRKLLVGVVLTVGALLLLAKSSDTIIERFLTAPEGSALARARFEMAAAAMLDEHVLGVGLNQFSNVLDTGGYADRFGMPRVDRDAVAHHVYLLTGAELGWLGLVVYVWLIAMPLWIAVKGAARLIGDPRGDLLLGCAAGMVVMHIHGFAEWIARQTPMMYLFWTVAGLAVGTYRSTCDHAADRLRVHQAELEQRAARRARARCAVTVTSAEL